MPYYDSIYKRSVINIPSVCSIPYLIHAYPGSLYYVRRNGSPADGIANFDVNTHNLRNARLNSDKIKGFWYNYLKFKNDETGIKCVDLVEDVLHKMNIIKNVVYNKTNREILTLLNCTKLYDKPLFIKKNHAVKVISQIRNDTKCAHFRFSTNHTQSPAFIICRGGQSHQEYNH